MTRAGKICWIYTNIGFNYYSLSASLGLSRECDIAINAGQDGGITWEDIETMILIKYDHNVPKRSRRRITLDADQKQFFFVLFKAMREKTEREFLKEFSN